MIDENHRLFSIDTFKKYQDGQLECVSYSVSDCKLNQELHDPNWKSCIYILRLGKNAEGSSDIASIPNHLDKLGILYIGGHESGRITGRFGRLINGSRKAESIFNECGYAKNDMKHDHSVANCLTTSILRAGFTIEKCTIDLVRSGADVKFDELELLIGYQETFHHLPPWNASRGGVSAFHE